MKLVYFAWVRERIGFSEEQVTPPPGTESVADLISWLKTRGEEYAHAFENERLIRAAIDHQHAKPEASLSGAQEVAFFPPMTGG